MPGCPAGDRSPATACRVRRKIVPTARGAGAQTGGGAAHGPGTTRHGRDSAVTDHVDVAPVMLRWARERSGRSMDDLAGRFPRLTAWEAGTASPTMRQLEDYAQATYTPFGYFFLSDPPVERLPIPDFRTVANGPIRTPSPDLLDSIYACEQRQAWYHQYAEEHGHEP